MGATITNIHDAAYDTGEARGERFRFLDLSGTNLGVRVEELPPGGTSSNHHYHSLEEEHVLVLAGNGTLHSGSDALQLKPGDHVCFAAGEPIAHHIENRSAAAFRFLVFGERRAGDVVVYPEASDRF